MSSTSLSDGIGFSPSGATYSIVDEPSPSRLSHLACNPVWPLLAIMFGGAWLAWPWYILNGFAIGSPTRTRELALALGGFVGNFVITLSLLALLGKEVITQDALLYLLVGLTVWKLGISYWLYTMQGRAFSLWEHYGGVARNGLIIVALSYLVLRQFGDALNPFWVLVLR